MTGYPFCLANRQRHQNEKKSNALERGHSKASPIIDVLLSPSLAVEFIEIETLIRSRARRKLEDCSMILLNILVTMIEILAPTQCRGTIRKYRHHPHANQVFIYHTRTFRHTHAIYALCQHLSFQSSGVAELDSVLPPRLTRCCTCISRLGLPNHCTTHR